MIQFDLISSVIPLTISEALFKEYLRALSEDGTEVGFYECNVSVDACTNTVFVNAKSEYTIADTEHFTSLLSELDSKLNLLTETYECKWRTKDGESKRIIQTKLELSNLIVEIEEYANSESKKFSQRYSLDDIELFLSNGALLVVERMYIRAGAEGQFAAHTLDSDGTICNFSFELLCEDNAAFCSKTSLELATKQTLESSLGFPKTTYKYFTTHGQLLSVVQVGLPVVFKTTDLPNPLTKTQYLSPSNSFEDEFHWVDNYMLFSKFIERKEELKSQYHLYVYNHPEFVAMVKDFLQMILMEKPQDTLNFAADFFTSFSKRQIPPPRLKRI